jgi:transcriptional regulator with XRE-family HTH domain
MTSVLQKNLRSQLKEKNLSVHALEKKSGLKAGAVQNILQGKSKKPSADLIFAIAQELHCSVEELLQETTPLKKQPSKKWVPGLYMDALKIMNALVDERKIEMGKESLLKLVEEVYLYSLDGGLEQADRKFSEWLISNSCC